MEQKALAEKIGTRASAVNNWEKGRSRPDLSLLPAICGALGISLQQLFGLEEPAGALSGRESRLLAGYRQLNSGDRYTVDTLVRTMLAVDQARERQQSRRRVYELPLADRSLAAGIGDPAEYEGSTEPFYLYEVPGIGRADFVFRISGDSMEPAFHDGDYVLVERIPDAPALLEGETGAFSVNNELYIKQYEADGLHSLNPKYPVMSFSGDSRVYLIGRVLSAVSPQDVASEEDVRLYRILKEERA